MNIQKTRCPHCSSIFTVSDTQLSIRDGYTRCGKCFKVFKADDYLLVEPQQPASSPTPTLFDDVAKTPAPIFINATIAKPSTPTHIEDLRSVETSKPAPAPPPIQIEARSEASAAEDKLASTLNDQPLATLARMLANELSMLKPQPLLPIALANALAVEPAATEAAPEPIAEPEPPEVPVPSTPKPAPVGVFSASTPLESTAPVMSHIFEQEFNDLWLSATDHSKPLASAVASATAAEKKREENVALKLDDGLTEHFNDVEENELTEHFNTAEPVIEAPAPVVAAREADLSDAMIEQPSIHATRAVEEDPHDDEEDLFSYLNKNNVAAAPVNLRPKRILPGMQAPIDPKAANKTANRSTIAPHPRQPGSKRTALPPIKRPNVVMERLTQPVPFFSINLPKALGWGFLSLIMLGLLGVQYVYFNFDHLAAEPAYSPTLKQMCDYVGCEVPIVDVHKIKISNKLARHYPESPTDSTRFTATMVNLAETSQPYPSIQVLILKKGEVQSGRIVKPSEYIPNGYTALAKIPANTPVQIRFVLKIPREQIAVFALDPI